MPQINPYKRPVITIDKCPCCKQTTHGEVSQQLTTRKFFIACHNKLQPGWDCNAFIQVGDPRIPVEITVACESCGFDVTGIPVTTPDGAHLLITCPKCSKKIRLV